MRKIFCVCLAAVLLTAGCASTVSRGRKFDEGAATRIEQGKTTRAQVQAMLGEPVARRQNQDGTEIWVYGHVRGSAVAFMGAGHTWAEGDRLAVKFGPDGVVQAVQKDQIRR